MKKINLQTSRQSQHLTARDWSRFGLDTLRKSIDNKHTLDLKLREEIKFQKQNSAKFVQKIKINVHKTEESAIEFVTKLEQQIQKNKHLNMLVAHYQLQIQKIKKQQYQNLINNVQNSQYEQVCHKIQNLQKQLGVQAKKSNSAISQVQKKYQIVKGQRRERTVFSNMFNHFQTQLFNLELYYKQLVIERTLWNKKYIQKVQEFQKISSQGQKKLREYQNKIKNQQSQEFERQEALNNLQNNSIFFRTRSKLPNIKPQKIEKNRQSQLIQSELKSFQKQKKVKQIFFDFKVQNIQQLALIVKSLQSSNKQIANQIEEQNNKINGLEYKIKQSLRQKKGQNLQSQKTSKQYEKEHRNKIKLKKKISKCIEFQQKLKNQFSDLKQSQQFKKLTQTFKNNLSHQQDFVNIFTQLDCRLNQNVLRLKNQKNSPIKMYKSRLVQELQLKDRQNLKLPFQSQSTMNNIHLDIQKCQKQQISKSRKKSSVSRIKQKQKQEDIHSQKKIQRKSIKKLSAFIKQAQSKTKNNFFLASKNQMIKYGLKVFQTEGNVCTQRISNFKVQYA